VIEAASDVLLATCRCCSCRWAWASSPTWTPLARHGLALLAVLLLSTWIGLAVTALTLPQTPNPKPLKLSHSLLISNAPFHFCFKFQLSFMF
jgi:hypothetical protein